MSANHNAWLVFVPAVVALLAALFVRGWTFHDDDDTDGWHR